MTNTPSEKAVRAPFSGDDASEQAVLHTLRTHYVDGLRRTFVFGGRSTRGQYWGFLAVNMAVLLALLALGFIGMSAEPNYWLIPAGVYVIPAMLANLSNAVRRLRDTGISPFWVLIGWLGLPGWIAVFVLLLRPTKSASRKPRPGGFVPHTRGGAFGAGRKGDRFL